MARESAALLRARARTAGLAIPCGIMGLGHALEVCFSYGHPGARLLGFAFVRLVDTRAAGVEPTRFRTMPSEETTQNVPLSAKPLVVPKSGCTWTERSWRARPREAVRGDGAPDSVEGFVARR